MRFSIFLAASLAVALSIGIAACTGGNGGESYDNLMDCVTDHTMTDGLTEAHAITHCLVDFDFGQDFTDQAGCVQYVTDHGGYPDSRDAACTDYFVQTGQ